jgi:hypothetical protein
MLLKFVCKGQTPFSHVIANQIVQPRLVNWNFAALERAEFVRIFVNANDPVAEVGEAGSRNEDSLQP